MALTDNAGGGLSAADVAAVMNGNGNNGWGFGNDGGWWILLLFLFAMNGNGWGGGNGGFAPFYGGQADMQRGFDQQATQAAISNVQQSLGNGFADAAVARCQGNAAITSAVTTGTAAITNTLNQNQMGLYQTLNANQNANTQNMNSLAMSLQQCCCENRAGLADLKYTVTTENCQDRQALNEGLRDLMAQNTANTQAIVNSQTQGFQNVLDKLCQMELDTLKTENQNLRTQLNMAGLAASQTAQTAQLIQDNNAQTQALIQRIAPAPIPAYTVANPNGCGCNYGCSA